jgi:hypothetical protein
MLALGNELIPAHGALPDFRHKVIISATFTARSAYDGAN